VAVLAVLLIAGAIAGLVVRSSGSSGLNIRLGADGPTPKTDAQLVEEAYRHYLDADRRASEIPDPSSPLLPVYATGPQLKAATDAIEKLRQQGQATRQIPNSMGRTVINIVSVDGDKATLTECSVDDGIVVRSDNGKPAFDYPPGSVATFLFTAQMIREGGSWKVASLKKEQRWQGVAGCAVGQS